LFEVVDEEGVENDCFVEGNHFLIGFDSIDGGDVMLAIGGFPLKKVGAGEADVGDGLSDLKLKLAFSNLHFFHARAHLLILIQANN
jgi:hypothetical protein